MSQEDLRRALEQLHAELGRTGALERTTRERLEALQSDVRNALSNVGRALGRLRGRLTDRAEERARLPVRQVPSRREDAPLEVARVRAPLQHVHVVVRLDQQDVAPRDVRR